jgi:hypothetical protein
VLVGLFLIVAFILTRTRQDTRGRGRVSPRSRQIRWFGGLYLAPIAVLALAGPTAEPRRLLARRRDQR